MAQPAPSYVTADQLYYGYIPTVWICALYAALFLLSTIIHLGQAIRSKMWWLLPTVVLGAIGETIGWSGRLWSSQTRLGNKIDPYTMQIATLLIFPTPIVAANFVILSIIVKYLGREYSRLSPKWFTIVFCSADVIAFAIQAIGVGLTSTALQIDIDDPKEGAPIMLAGVAFHLVSIIVYVILGTEFLYRFLTNKPIYRGVPPTGRAFDRRIKLMVLGLCLSTLFLTIRSIYRIIELAEGWTGRIIRSEVYFSVLDGAMIVLAVYTMNILHPGNLLAHVNDSGTDVEGSRRSSGDGVDLKKTDYSSQGVWDKRDGESTATAITGNAQTV